VSLPLSGANVKFGIFSLPTYFPDVDGSIKDFYRRIFALLEDSEALGFDVAWANEHHFHPFGGMIPLPAVLLAAVAARTSRIRLGTSVALLPLHHPLQLAEAYAMLDQISGGRLEFGIGRGFVKHDYETLGVPFDDGQERLIESIEVILKAWQNQPFSHEGRFYHFSDVSVWPPPLQKPHPPVWGAATRTPGSFSWIGSRGFDLLTVAHVNPLEELAKLVRVYRDAALAAGRDPTTIGVSTHFQVYCAEDREEALREGKEAIRRYREQNVAARLQGSATLAGMGGEPPEQLIAEGRVCIGRPDECATILARARDVVGLTEIDCTFYFGGISYEKARRSLELFASEVMPCLNPILVSHP
jgi:natural product biosynthesis luciferase-like monooxygenase protein